VFIPRWFQSTCCKIIHWDVITGADTWRDEAVNRYQQQQQREYSRNVRCAKFHILRENSRKIIV